MVPGEDQPHMLHTLVEIQKRRNETNLVMILVLTCLQQFNVDQSSDHVQIRNYIVNRQMNQAVKIISVVKRLNK